MSIENSQASLHGSYTTALEIRKIAGASAATGFLYRTAVPEACARISAGWHLTHLGVYVFKLYEARRPGPDAEPPSLEESMGNNPQARTLYVSRAGKLAVVSSQLGYDLGSEVGLVPVGERIAMHDYPAACTEAQVLRAHSHNVALFGGLVQLELPQPEADAIFRTMLAGAQGLDQSHQGA